MFHNFAKHKNQALCVFLNNMFHQEASVETIRLFQEFCPFLWVYFKLQYLSEYSFNLIEISAIRISVLLLT